jgi:hypothetical protein
MDGKIAIEEHFVTPALEDLVLNRGGRRTPSGGRSTGSRTSTSAWS